MRNGLPGNQLMSGPNRSRKISLLASLLLLTLTLTANAQIPLDLPAQPLGASLTAVGSLGHLNVMFDPSVVDGLQAPALKAELNADDALGKLLAGTKLHAVRVDANTIRVMAEPDPKRSQTTGVSDRNGPLSPGTGGREADTVAVIDDDVKASRPEPGPSERAGDQKRSTAYLDEVVVTGSHIHGLKEQSSPTITIDRTDIDRSGYADVGDLIRSLPENFGGGNNPAFQGNSPTPQNGSFSAGSSPNLRGLGPQSTLTLVSGHRLGQDGLYGAVDISLIPLAVVDHVDVVTDSGSAEYGSDAVAGVVNFVLKKNYNGADTAVTYGDSTDGGGQQWTISQLVGGAWDQGSVIFAYQNSQQKAVLNTQRDFTSTVASPTSLLPQTSRHSFYVAINQRVSDVLSGSADGLYTSRDAGYDITFPANLGGFSLSTPLSITQYAANGGITAALPGEWTVGATVSVAQQKTNSQTEFTAPPPSSLVGNEDFIGRTQAVELVADGPIGSWNITPRAAFGGGYRRESLDVNNLLSDTWESHARHIDYAFVEINAPVWQPDGSGGSRGVSLNASGRYDRYSDTGGRFVPKLGALFTPLAGLTFRSSWSQAFRAPTLQSLYGSSALQLENTLDPLSASSTSITLNRTGSNPTVRPETADSWTAGVDFIPNGLKQLRLSGTYFNIVYKSRIEQISGLQAVLSDPQYAPLVTRNPSPALQQSLIAAAGDQFFNYSGSPYDPATVAALIDERYLNLATQHVDGLDFLATVKSDLPVGRLDTFANTTYLQIRQRVTSASPEVEIAGVSFNPPRMKARAGVTYSIGPWSATGIVNWTASSTDAYEPTTPKVAAWTVFDLQAAYVSQSKGLLEGLRASVSVQNLFNRDPPYLHYDGRYAGFHYDTLNASPMGRFIALQVSKAWGLPDMSR
jgi:iron complex outermembrane recepter protein